MGLTDEELAKIIAEEAKRNKQLSHSLGPKAFLLSNLIKDDKPSSINKSFLVNTIVNVEQHNRREEIDECWRQNKLLKNVHDLKSNIKSEPNLDNQIKERNLWAEKKLRSLANLQSDEDVSSQSSSDSETSKNSGRKRKRSHKKKHKKEKKHKKKKHKKDSK